jgi:bifunctional DNA-binding transcriptional regulator/antitoxin component of YhaV-PrlF toxin-antitoxin module
MEQNGIRKLFQLSVDDLGRLVLPAKSRIREAVQEGEPLFALEGPDGSFKVQTRAETIREIQEIFAHS